MCTIPGVSQAFRWKFAGAKHLRRMEACFEENRGPTKVLEVLQGKKAAKRWGKHLSKDTVEHTVVSQNSGISRKFWNFYRFVKEKYRALPLICQ